MTINERIKKIRISVAKMNQIDFSKVIGIKQSSLSDIETGKTKEIDERIIIILSNEFGINGEWIRSGKGEMYKRSDLALAELIGNKIENMSEVGKQSVMEFLKLSENQQKYIIDFMKKMNSGK
jgi:transcriptional regulator with XRE-family HTH domain